MKARMQPKLREMRSVVSLLTLMIVLLLRVTPDTAVAQRGVMTTLNLLTVKPLVIVHYIESIQEK